MQVSIQTTSGLERKLTVGVPAERVDGEVNARLKKASSTVRLDGFRPGKVPMKVMKQRFGAGVRQEVLQEVMSQSFQEAVVQAAAVRGKPITLTALAAILGALFILDDPIFNGLAIALIFGILISTLLTLIVIPVMFYAYNYQRFEG